MKLEDLEQRARMIDYLCEEKVTVIEWLRSVKVYLHQDVFILNRNFLKDTLEIFQENDRIGMLGILGAVEFPADAKCYNCKRLGNIMDYDACSKKQSGGNQQNCRYFIVGYHGDRLLFSVGVPLSRR